MKMPSALDRNGINTVYTDKMYVFSRMGGTKWKYMIVFLQHYVRGFQSFMRSDICPMSYRA